MSRSFADEVPRPAFQPPEPARRNGHHALLAWHRRLRQKRSAWVRAASPTIVPCSRSLRRRTARMADGSGWCRTSRDDVARRRERRLPSIGTVGYRDPEEGPRIETQGLTDLHLFVADLDRSLRFYREVFGLEAMFREGPRMVFLGPPNSSDTITLNEVPDKAGALVASTTSGSVSPTRPASMPRSTRWSGPEAASSTEASARLAARTRMSPTRTAT
jgi:Bleomycin resistance protein-like N-terminal